MSVFRRFRTLILSALAVLAFVIFYYRNQQDSQPISNSTVQFREFNKSPTNRFERLLIDPTCLKQIKNGGKCKSPLQIATTNINLANANLDVQYVIETVEDTDYFLLKGFRLRAIPRIDTKFTHVELDNGQTIEVSVPIDITIFLRYLENSKFIKSKKMKMNRKSKKQNINLETAGRIMRTMRQKLELFARKFDQPMTAFIVGGTLLGWYRENTVISHTNDIDFGMKALDLKHADEFIKFIESTFYMRDRIGFPNDSLEFRFRVHGVSTDLFILYQDKNDSKQQDYYPGVDFGEHRQLRWYIPHIEELCSADLLNSLVYVPCNVEDVLTADYGNWTKDKPTSNYHYATSGQVRHGKKLGPKEWKQIVKYPKGTVIGKTKKLVKPKKPKSTNE